MKKLNFLLGTLLLASTSVFTSCFSNDIPSIVISGSQGGGNNNNDGVTLGEISQSSNYNYTILCNVAADIRVGKSYESVTKVSSTLSYMGKGGIGEKIYIKATTSVPGYTKDEIKKIVTLDTNGKVIRLTFAKNPSEATTVDKDRRYAISLNEAKEKTVGGNSVFVENTPENKMEPYPSVTTDLKMEIVNSMNNNALNSGTPGEALYTVTAKEAVMSDIEANIGDVDPEWFPVLTIMCKPDGAQFGASPAKVVAKNKYFATGMVFRCKGAVKDVAELDPNGGSVTMQFSHFSDYIIESEVKVHYESVREIETQTLLDCKVGNHTYNYFVYSGCQYDDHSNEFINKYLEAKFGKYQYAAKGEFVISNLSQRATVPYTVRQKVYTYRVTFGKIPYSVDVYGPEKLFIGDPVIYDPTKHSGGAAY